MRRCEVRRGRNGYAVSRVTVPIIDSYARCSRGSSTVLAGTPTFEGQVSPFRCARAALSVQAQGTPLSHKKYFVMLAGTPTFEG